VRQGRHIGHIALALLLACSGLSLAADEISVNATVDGDTVGLDDQFTFTVTVDGAARGVEVSPLPRMDGLSVLSGPNVGQQSSISMVNGSFEQKSILTYSYRMLPEKEGRFTIPSLTVTHEGREYQTGDVLVTVVKQSQRARQSRQPANPFDRRPRGRSQQSQVSRNVFIRAVTPKQKLYQGEGLPLEFRVHTQYDVANFGFRKDPRFEGFWVEKVEGQPQMRTTTVDGEQYGVFPAYRYVLYPTTAGRYTIDTQTLGINVITSDRFSFFDRQEQIFRRTDPLDLEVLPLPSEPPEGFSGAVGEYDFTVALGSDRAVTGDAVTLTLTVQGQGNLRGLSPPDLPPLPDFRIYDPETRDDLRVTPRGIRGKRTWEYVVVPRAPGRQTIPPVAFSYFSPEKGDYRSVTSTALDLEVARGESYMEGTPVAGAQNTAEAVARKDVELVEGDIRFIRAVPETLEDQAVHRHRAGWYLLILLLPLLVNGGALVVGRLRLRSPEALAAQRQRRALRAALVRVGDAEKAARSGGAAAFHNGLEEALRGFVADRFSRPAAAGLTLDEIRHLLEDRDVPEERWAELSAMLETCDFVQYAPSQAGRPDEIKRLAVRARELLKNLERDL